MVFVILRNVLANIAALSALFVRCIAIFEYLKDLDRFGERVLEALSNVHTMPRSKVRIGYVSRCGDNTLQMKTSKQLCRVSQVARS